MLTLEIVPIHPSLLITLLTATAVLQNKPLEVKFMLWSHLLRNTLELSA